MQELELIVLFILLTDFGKILIGLVEILLFWFLIREKCKLREDIVGRRQRKLLMRHTRQKYLEEAAVREAELLQELDRFYLLNSISYIVQLQRWFD